jgi:hypothetical protein
MNHQISDIDIALLYYGIYRDTLAKNFRMLMYDDDYLGSWNEYSRDWKRDRHNSKRDDTIELADSVTQIITEFYRRNRGDGQIRHIEEVQDRQMSREMFFDLWKFLLVEGRNIKFSYIYLYDLWKQRELTQVKTAEEVNEMINKIQRIGLDKYIINIKKKLFSYLRERKQNRGLPLVIIDDGIKKLLSDNNDAPYKNPSTMGELVISYSNAYRKLYDKGESEQADRLRDFVYRLKDTYHFEGIKRQKNRKSKRKSKKNNKRKSKKLNM